MSVYQLVGCQVRRKYGRFRREKRDEGIAQYEQL